MAAESHRFNPEDMAEGAMRRTGFGVAWLRQSTSPQNARHWTRRHTRIPTIYSQLLSSHDTSDLSDNWESRDDTEASVHWKRPDVTGRKLWTFEDFLHWCVMFNKIFHGSKCVWKPHIAVKWRLHVPVSVHVPVRSYRVPFVASVTVGTQNTQQLLIFSSLQLQEGVVSNLGNYYCPMVALVKGMIHSTKGPWTLIHGQLTDP